MMQSERNAVESVADREFVITRVVDAPARLLFEAHSKPEHVKRWFGPKGWPLTHCEMDFRVGGKYRFQMTSTEGEKGPFFGGTYLEIVPNKKIVYDDAFQQPGAEKMVVTVTFEERGGKTTLTMTTLFASAAMKKEHIGMGFNEGVNSGLDQLEEVVAGLRS